MKTNERGYIVLEYEYKGRTHKKYSHFYDDYLYTSIVLPGRTGSFVKKLEVRKVTKIRRDKDNEVFSVGDEVVCDREVGKIESMAPSEVFEDCLHICLDTGHGYVTTTLENINHPHRNIILVD